MAISPTHREILPAQKSMTSLLQNNRPAFLAEQEIMSVVWHNAPYAPFCSDNKTVGIQLPRREAFKQPYVQLNPPCNIKFFIIDIDHEDEYLWNNEQVPTPNVIIRNKTNKKCHLLFRVDDILVKSVNDDVVVRSEPIVYANAVYYGLCNKLKADRAAFSNVVSKNPFHPNFNSEFLHSRIYKLKDLAEFAEPDWSVYQWGEKENPNPESRHLSLFHKVRHIAYRLVNQYRLAGDMEGFYHQVLKECLAGNQFAGHGFTEDENLNKSSVKAIAKSITTWTWNNYVGSSCNRGVMKLPHDMEQKQKQQKAAKYVAELKRERTKETLFKVVKDIVNCSSKPSQQMVAMAAKVSLSTVKRYWSDLKEITSITQDDVIDAKKVSLAIHKVSSLREVDKVSVNVSFNYQLSSFLLNKHKQSLSTSSVLFNQEFLSLTSCYSYQVNSGRFVESGSNIFNVQTLSKSIRQSVFKGWYEIDLIFSHGQMIKNVMFDFIENVLKPRLLNADNLWHNLEIDSWQQIFEHYSLFLNELEANLKHWTRLSGLTSKELKVALVSYLHGAGQSKFNQLLKGKAGILFADGLFSKVIKTFKLCRKSIVNLSLKLNSEESKVFKPYWGKVLVIHDGILVESSLFANEISNSLNLQHTFAQV